MSDTLTIDASMARAESSEDEVRANLGASPDSQLWSFVAVRVPRRVPLFMPRGQRYYWSREWQQGEAEAEAELRRGEGVTFDNPQDAFRWLDSPED